MKYAIVTPAHNEEKNIGKFLAKLDNFKLPYYVVDDGSIDKTYTIAKKYKGSVLCHAVNLGKGAALKTGAQAAFEAGYDTVIFIDSDGQHDVNDIPRFIEKLNDGYDIVWGSRNLSYGVPFIRYMGNKFASIFIRLLFGIYVSDILCGYRALTKKAYKAIQWESAGYGVETEMVVRAAKCGLAHCEVSVSTIYLDEFKGVSIMDATGIFFDVLRWRLKV